MGSLTMNDEKQAGDQPQAQPHRFGIQNGLIYWGIVVLMATLLLWLGVELAKRIEWFLPYAGGLGLSLIAVGYLLEIRKARKARASKRTQQEPPRPPSSSGSRLPL